MPFRRALAVLGITMGWAVAQISICAKAGLLTFSEGPAFLDATAVEITPGKLPRMHVASELKTGSGRAEIMLGPCAVLHLDQDSAVRMISNRLIDVQVELTAGSAIVQADGSFHDVRFTFFAGGMSVGIAAKGTYRIDAAPAQVKVFAGKAIVNGVAVGAERIAQRGPLEMWSEGRLSVLARESGLEAERTRQEQAWLLTGKLAPVGETVTDRNRICGEW